MVKSTGMNSCRHYLERDIRISNGIAAGEALYREFIVDGLCVYPDDYSGGYFNDDGYLVILTTKRNFDEISFKSTNPLIVNNIIYEYAPHSYNSLISLQMFITFDYFIELGIVSTSLIDNRNAIKIDLEDLRNEEKVLSFLKTAYPGFDESMVYFGLDSVYTSSCQYF